MDGVIAKKMKSKNEIGKGSCCCCIDLEGMIEVQTLQG
jgi:hypothetical protein